MRYASEDDRHPARLKGLQQAASRLRRGVIDRGDGRGVHHEVMHRGRCLREKALHFLDEARLVGVEQVGAKTIDDQAGWVPIPGTTSLGTQRPSASGASTIVCGR